MSPLRIALPLAAVLLASSCALPRLPHPPFDEAYVSRWLPAVEDGVTTRTDIYANWGVPSEKYEGGRIAAYRILLVESGNELGEEEYRRRLGEIGVAYRELFFPKADFELEDVNRLSDSHTLLVITAANRAEFHKRLITRPGEYGFVVVFDSDGVVRRHSLVRVHP